MGIQKLILNFVLTIEKFFLGLYKIKKNRITFISLDSNELNMDFELLYNALDKQKYDVKLCLIRYEKNLKGQFLYFLNCLKQMYFVYTSALIILNNNNYVVSNYKRKGVKVLQIWHACGAIKKFGNAIDRQYAISNYDYVLATSSYWKKPYSEAFGVDEKEVYPLGMSRNDELFDEQLCVQYKQQLLNKYPQLIGKKIILYAPTFRGNIYKGFKSVEFDAVKLLDNLDDDYVLIYKFHPLLGDVKLANDSRIINMNSENTHQLFCLCDYMISDYSSILFDYLILQKPYLFYVPDLQNYESDIGCFVDIPSLGLPIAYNMDDIIHIIKEQSFDYDRLNDCLDIFFDIKDNKSTSRIITFIDEKLDD